MAELVTEYGERSARGRSQSMASGAEETDDMTT